MITVIIAEDHAAVRTTLKKLLEEDDQIDVVALAEDGEEAARLVVEYEPDVLVTDVNMDKMGGIALLKEIAREGLPTQVLFVSMFTESTLIQEALDEGVAGFVCKPDLVDHLIPAIYALHKGEQLPYLSPLARDTLDGSR